MALGPNRNLEHTIAAMEKSIDKHISNHNGYGDIRIDVRIISRWDYQVFKINLLHKYIRSGWRAVDVVYDQRDGDFIWFKV